MLLKRPHIMRVLALETTDPTGSVAALDSNNLLLELDLSRSQRSAQSLLPAVKNLLAAAGWRPADVQLVAVSIGPGSFTGLRVGVTTAKVFAYAVGADVLAINTLEAVAAGPCDHNGLTELSVAMDAQRGDVVAQAFVLEPPDIVRPLGQEELIAAEAWLARLAPGAVVTGPALVRLASRLPAGIRALEPRYWPPRAAAVGRLALRDYAAGRRDDLWKLVPHYFRRSAAEEKWDALGK
jgi:tRNA threonylcarbamoyladenosine biosynthesis protein TsaB